MREDIRVVELFSGIGSQAKALNNIGFKTKILATCEWDLHAFVAYDFIHNGKHIDEKVERMDKEDLLNQLYKYNLSTDGKKPAPPTGIKHYNTEVLKTIYSSIINTNNLIDISKVKGEQMSGDIDLMTYSFPCQDLSNVGAFHGYNKGIEKGSGSRSSLLWEVGRILKEIKTSKKNLPKYLVMENVPTLLSPKHKKNFRMWINDLEELGYISKPFLLNAFQFGIPQNRPRLLMLSIYVGNNAKKKKIVKDYFEKTDEEKIISDYKKSKYYKKLKVDDLLRTDYSIKKYYKEAVECTPNDTPSRQRIWDENPKIIDKGEKHSKQDYVRTITTKQDRNPNSGNIYFNNNIKNKCKWRYLTPRECLLFMGFTEDDYESLILNNIKMNYSTFFPRDKIIRMAGNSIPVKLLEGIFYQIYKIEELLA